MNIHNQFHVQPDPVQISTLPASFVEMCDKENGAPRGGQEDSIMSHEKVELELKMTAEKRIASEESVGYWIG